MFILGASRTNFIERITVALTLKHFNDSPKQALVHIITVANVWNQICTCFGSEIWWNIRMIQKCSQLGVGIFGMHQNRFGPTLSWESSSRSTTTNYRNWKSTGNSQRLYQYFRYIEIQVFIFTYWISLAPSSLFFTILYVIEQRDKQSFFSLLLLRKFGKIYLFTSLNFHIQLFSWQ